LADVSLTKADDLTLAEATGRDVPALRRLEMAHGLSTVLQAISRLVLEADTLCGGRATTTELELITRLTLQNYRHRTMESLVLALREGLGKATKVYGKITWPLVNQWMQEHEDAILRASEEEHARHVVKGDNYDGRWTDRMEAPDRKDRLIDQLRRKLEVKKNDGQP